MHRGVDDPNEVTSSHYVRRCIHLNNLSAVVKLFSSSFKMEKVAFVVTLDFFTGKT